MKDLTAAIKRIETSRQTHVDWRDYWLSTPGHEDCESCKATAAIAGDLDRQVRVIAEYDNVLACLREAESAEAAHEAEKAARVALVDLCQKVIDVHANVVMDTDKDRELHARAIATFRAHLALLAGGGAR